MTEYRRIKKNASPFAGSIKQVSGRTGFHSSLILLATSLAAKETSAADQEYLHFVPNFKLIVFSFEQENGDFWLKITDGNWLKVPKKFVYFEDGILAVEQEWLQKHAKFLVTHPKTTQGDYIAFEIGFPKIVSSGDIEKIYLHPNLPGLDSAEFMPGGGVGIRLINGSSIVVDPKQFLIADDKIIISSTWYRSNLPNVQVRSEKSLGFQADRLVF